MSDELKLPEWPVYVDDVSTIYEHDQALIAALRARLKLALSSLETYAGKCDELHHPRQFQHDWKTPCPIEAKIQSIIAALKEPSP